MRPIYGALSTPTATFPAIFNGLLFRSIQWMCVQNLKFVALPVPENMGYSKNLGSPWIRPRSIFSKILNGFLFGWILLTFQLNLKSIASTIPEIIAIGVFGGSCEPNLGEEEAVGSRGWYPSKECWSVPIGSPVSTVTFHLSLRVSEILASYCRFSSTPLFPTPPLVSSKFTHFPPEVGAWLLDYEEQRCWANCTCN